jgi:phage-related protein
MAGIDSSEAVRDLVSVKFAKAVFVLHAFQKKSNRGIATPKAEIDLIKRRLKMAEQVYQEAYGESKP